jgi:N-acetylmuramoyl-L-alanine amidase
MPACLVELGYITTPSDAASLTNKKNVDLMGRGLYQAFVAFKKSRTGKGSATVVEPEQPKVETPQPVQPKAEVAPVEQPVQQEAQTVPAEQPQQQEPEPKAAPVETKAKAADANEPVFKIQFLTSSTKLKNGDARLKGLTDVDCYKEGGVWKYTIGSSTNYNEIYRLRKQVMEKFPQAFIIAFKNGEKVDAAKAYQEYKQRKNIK